ncbi:MAG TPA: nuclear transport factor 2 family protein [Mucilaginibacter sp.]|nr:nuclear transport factor 2 family protein [Mucilaginibacter sp.]
MRKNFLIILCFSLIVQAGYADGHRTAIIQISKDRNNTTADSAASRSEIMKIINMVINASSSFDVNAVADLYTPNAVIADEEPPFSWNGPTAGVQWVSTVEKTCKDFKLKGFKGKIGRVNVYLQSTESIYVVVPVDYTGEIKGEPFEEDGAFTFVFRIVSGKWMIKSQVWVAKKGM